MNAGIVFNAEFRATEYYKGSPHAVKQKINTIEMYLYYEREGACDKTKDYEPLNDMDTKDAFDYYHLRLGSTGGFDSNGDISAGKSIQLAEQYKPEIIYRWVISFDDQCAIENNLKNKKNIKELVRKTMDKNLRICGFDPENIIWSAYYHINTDNPHIHIPFYEMQPTRKRYEIPKNKISGVKSQIIRNLKLNTNLYIERDESKKSLIEAVRHLDFTDQMKKYLSHSYNLHKSKGDSKNNEEILKSLVKLNDVLPIQGSMKYNSANIKPYRAVIKDLVKVILDDHRISPFMQEYSNKLQEEVEQQQQIYGTGDKEYFDEDGNIRIGKKEGIKLQEKFLQQRIEEIETRVANMILQSILDYRKDVNDFLLEGDAVAAIDKQDGEDMDGSQAAEIIKGKKPTGRFRKKNLNTRSNALCYGAANVLSKAIEESYYAIAKQQEKARTATEKAKQEIKANNVYER